MRWAFLLIAIGLLESCFLFRDHKRSSFSYTNPGGETITVPTIIPKGFKRQETIKDSLGNTGLLYHYSHGAVFYMMDFPKGFTYQSIDTTFHIPKVHLQGGIFYKGIDPAKQWWREALPATTVRIGYFNVNNENEVLFDSAVNYLRPLHLERKRRKR